MRKPTRAWAVVLLLLGIATSCGPLEESEEELPPTEQNAAVGSTASRSGTPTLQAWAPGFQGYTGSTSGPTTSAQDALNFDLIIDNFGKTYPNGKAFSPSVIASMKTQNPKLRFLVYLNGCCQNSRDDFRYPESAYAHNASGARIMVTSTGVYLMNRRDPTWKQQRVAQCQSAINSYGYDGCFYDSTSSDWALKATSSPPIDPATGQVWAASAYDLAGNAIWSAVKSATAKPVAVNGLESGRNYFASNPTSLFDAVDIGMSETFVRNGRSDPITSFRSEAAWKQDVEMLIDAGRRGRTIIVTVKTWNGGTQAQINQVHRYALATFLLGSHPKAYFDFQPEHSYFAPFWYYAAWNTNIGAPAGAYTHPAGYYQRAFTGGKVLVNPTSTAITVGLDALYTTLDGARVSSVRLPPHTGEVLVGP